MSASTTTTTNNNNNLNSIRLSELIESLTTLAPLSLAAKWDNVGLLVEPSIGASNHRIHRLLLTNDLTELVLNEAINEKCQTIVSYHPPIFSAFKRLTVNDVKTKIIIKAIEEKIAIFAPHTSWDSAIKGNNEWLARGISNNGSELIKMESIEQHSTTNDKSQLRIRGTIVDEQKIEEIITKLGGSRINGNGLEFLIPKRSATAAIDQIQSIAPSSSVDLFQFDANPTSKLGVGRKIELKSPISMKEMIERVKKHLNLPYLRISIPDNNTIDTFQIRTIGICAGSGSSVLDPLAGHVDLFLTGEMGHHSAHAAKAKNTAVILAEHSNTERGYLKEFQNMLLKEIEKKHGDGKIEIIISKVDADPLFVV